MLPGLLFPTSNLLFSLDNGLTLATFISLGNTCDLIDRLMIEAMTEAIQASALGDVKVIQLLLNKVFTDFVKHKGPRLDMPIVYSF